MKNKVDIERKTLVLSYVDTYMATFFMESYNRPIDQQVLAPDPFCSKVDTCIPCLRVNIKNMECHVMI